MVEAEINESETSLISAEDPNAIGGFSILGNFTSDSQKAVCVHPFIVYIVTDNDIYCMCIVLDCLHILCAVFGF